MKLDFIVVPVILVETLKAVEGAGLNVRPTNEQLQLNNKKRKGIWRIIIQIPFLLQRLEDLNMTKKEYYMVRIDENGNWTTCGYRKVTCDELDMLLDTYGKNVLNLCSDGRNSAMAMWAYFKNKICHGCYGDMINSYQLLTDDHKSLVDREHELRHMWDKYQELWRIRYFGSVENYYLEKAKESKEHFNTYYKDTETCQ